MFDLFRVMRPYLKQVCVAIGLFVSIASSAESLSSDCSSSPGNRATLEFIGERVTGFARDFIPDIVGSQPASTQNDCDAVKKQSPEGEPLKISANLTDEQIGEDPTLLYLVAMWIWNDEQKHEWNSHNKLSIANFVNCYHSKRHDDDATCQSWRYFSDYRNRRDGIQRELLDKYFEVAKKEVNPSPHSPRIEALLHLAAIKGHIASQFALARVYEDGVGIPVNFVQAQAWRIVGATQLPKQGDHIRDGYLYQHVLTDDEKRQAQLLAGRYLREYTNVWNKPSVTILQGPMTPKQK